MLDVLLTRKTIRKDRGPWTFYCTCCGNKVVRMEATEYLHCLVPYSATEALGAPLCSADCAECEVERLRHPVTYGVHDLRNGQSVMVNPFLVSAWRSS